MSIPSESINIRPLVGSTWTNFSYRVTNQPRDWAYISKGTHRTCGFLWRDIVKLVQKNIPKGLTCLTQQTYAFTNLQGTRKIVQNGRQIRSIFNFQVLDGDQRIVVRTGRPLRRDTVGFYDGGRLLQKREAVRLVSCYLQIYFFFQVNPTIQWDIRPSYSWIRQEKQLEVQFESYSKVSDNMEMWNRHSLLTSPEWTCSVYLRFIPLAGTNNRRNEKTLPELVGIISLGKSARKEGKLHW